MAQIQSIYRIENVEKVGWKYAYEREKKKLIIKTPLVFKIQ